MLDALFMIGMIMGVWLVGYFILAPQDFLGRFKK